MSEQKSIKLAHLVAEPVDGVKPGSSPVILHHSFADSKERWNNILQKLADNTGRQIYAVDARNHGESDWSDHFTIDAMAKDLIHFMDTIDSQKAILVGFSMGGWVVMRTALQAAERVEMLIVEDSLPTKLTPELCAMIQSILREQQQCLEKTTPEDSEASVTQKLKECFCRFMPPATDEQRKIVDEKKFFLKKTDKGYEYRTNLKVLIKSLDDPETVSGCYEGVYRGNALFLYAEKSFLEVGKHKDLVLKFFPDARFQEFIGADYALLEQCPDSYLTTVVKFINGS